MTSSARRLRPHKDAEVIDLHLDWLRRCGHSQTSRADRRRALLRLIRALPRPLLRTTEDDLDDWQAALTVAQSTIRTYTAHVRSFYRWAAEWGYVRINPARRLVIPKMPPRMPHPASENDCQLAIGCAPEPLKTWYVLAGFLGLRAGEIAALASEDVAEIGGRWTIAGIGKGGRSYRLPVPEQVMAYLRPHLDRPGPLWRFRDGRALTAHEISRIANKFLRRIGIHDTLHSFRHRFGTQFYAATRDPGATQRVMRHQDMSTTMAYYVQIDESVITAALNELARTGLVVSTAVP